MQNVQQLGGGVQNQAAPFNIFGISVGTMMAGNLFAQIVNDIAYSILCPDCNTPDWTFHTSDGQYYPEFYQNCLDPKKYPSEICGPALRKIFDGKKAYGMKKFDRYCLDPKDSAEFCRTMIQGCTPAEICKSFETRTGQIALASLSVLNLMVWIGLSHLSVRAYEQLIRQLNRLN